MVIRSYAKAFNYERRLYYIPWSKNRNLEVPGTPRLQAIAYCAIVLVTMIALSHIPPFSYVLSMLQWMMYPAIAIGVASWGSMGDFDGRYAHQHLRDWLIFQWCNRKRWHRSVSGYSKIPLTPDIDYYELQHGVLRGPGVVDFAVPVKLSMRRGKQTIRSDQAGEKSTLVLFPHEEVVVRL